MHTTAFSSFRRGRKGLTLDATAELFGVDRTTVLRWEKGAVPIPIKRLDDVERITGISRRQLRPDIFGAMPEVAA